MKLPSVILLAALVGAGPLDKRQGKGKGGEGKGGKGGGGKGGGGKGGGGGGQVCFVWARGSLEPAPMGLLIGPQLQSALRTRIPGLRTYPVMYGASIATNISPQRTDAGSIAKGVAAFKEASGCGVIVAGGYSQGAAVMHNVIGRSLDASIKNKIAGVALFGDTMKQQEGGKIKNFAGDRVKIFCTAGDAVCSGTLAVGITHLAYSQDAASAATFLSSKVTAFKGGKLGSSEGSGGSSPSQLPGGKGGKGGKGAGGAGKGAGGKGGKGGAPGGGKGKGGGPPGGGKGGLGGKGKGSDSSSSSSDDSSSSSSSSAEAPAPKETAAPKEAAPKEAAPKGKDAAPKESAPEAAAAPEAAEEEAAE